MDGGKGVIKVTKNLFKELRKHRKISLRPKWCLEKEKEKYFFLILSNLSKYHSPLIPKNNVLSHSTSVFVLC